VVDCADLPEALAAELEARARATLLTSDLPATATISCTGENVVIHVQAGDDGVTLKLRVRTATLREEVLRALDRALADLRAGLRPEFPTEGADSAPSPRAERSGAALERRRGDAPPEAVAPVVAPAVASPASPPAGAETLSDRKAEVSAQLMGEAWGKHVAVGGGVGAALRFGAWSCGIRAGAFHPAGFREFTVLEGHALAEAAFTANALAGLRFGVGAGPSLLLVSPSSGVSAPGPTLKSAVRFEAQLSRPFRFGRVELAPWLGLRFFSAERGVRVAQQSVPQQTPLIVGGVLPQVGLALSFGE